MVGKRIRFKFSKIGVFRYLSHLDIINIIARAIRRAKIKLEYSKGFNPKPKIIFGPPIPLGINSFAEYADVNVSDDIDTKKFQFWLNNQLEGRITISNAIEIPDGMKNLMSQVDIVEYLIEIEGYTCREDSIKELIQQAVKGIDTEKSIYDIKLLKRECEYSNILLLKVYGYTKTLRGRANRVFKLKDFLESLKNILTTKNMVIKSVLKNELYILKEGKKLTPFEVLQSFV